MGGAERIVERASALEHPLLLRLRVRSCKRYS